MPTVSSLYTLMCHAQKLPEFKTPNLETKKESRFPQDSTVTKYRPLNVQTRRFNLRVF